MSAAPARRSGRTAATREKLYAAAIELFGQRGIDQVTVEEISTAAGVAKGTVYYNFPGKEALVSGLIEDRIAALQAAIERLDDEGGTSDELFDVLLGFVEGQVRFAQLLIGELWQPSSRWHAELRDVRERLIAAIEPILSRERDGASLDKAPDAAADRTTAGAMLITCLGIGLDWQVYSPTRSRAEIATQLQALFRR